MSLAPADVSQPAFTVETLSFLRELLGQVSVSASDPNFERAAAIVANAIRELDEALTGSQDASREPK